MEHLSIKAFKIPTMVSPNKFHFGPFLLLMHLGSYPPSFIPPPHLLISLSFVHFIYREVLEERKQRSKGRKMWVNKCVKEYVGKEKRPEGEVFYPRFPYQS